MNSAEDTNRKTTEFLNFIFNSFFFIFPCILCLSLFTSGDIRSQHFQFIPVVFMCAFHQLTKVLRVICTSVYVSVYTIILFYFPWTHEGASTDDLHLA